MHSNFSSHAAWTSKQVKAGCDNSWSGLKMTSLSCVYVYVGMLSTWPGVQGHEPPPPEQEASPQGQLLALKGPTHPWLNAPELLCPLGCWFYRPIHSIAPQMEGECDDLPYAEGAAVRMHANNVHINTRAPHARHVHLINLSSFAFILVQEGLLLLCDPHYEPKDVGDPLLRNWLLAAALPLCTSCMYLVETMTYWNTI